jgi:hypothetical protein
MHLDEYADRVDAEEVERIRAAIDAEHHAVLGWEEDDPAASWRFLVATDDGIVDVRTRHRPSGPPALATELVPWRDVAVQRAPAAEWSATGGPATASAGSGLTGRNPQFRFIPSSDADNRAAADFWTVVSDQRKR